jgi:hypothetical protein
VTSETRFVELATVAVATDKTSTGKEGGVVRTRRQERNIVMDWLEPFGKNRTKQLDARIGLYG